MSFQAPKFLQKSVVAVDIFFSNPLLGSPISLTDGNGIGRVMDISPNDKEFMVERTATGDVSGYIQPITGSGTFYFHPQSPAIEKINGLIDAMKQATFMTAGSITVSGIGFEYTINNVFWDNSFIGYSASNAIDDYPMPFTCTPPSGAILNGIINAAGGLVGTL